jgi:hypothetical protein
VITATISAANGLTVVYVPESEIGLWMRGYVLLLVCHSGS